MRGPSPCVRTSSRRFRVWPDSSTSHECGPSGGAAPARGRALHLLMRRPCTRRSGDGGPVGVLRRNPRSVQCRQEPPLFFLSRRLATGRFARQVGAACPATTMPAALESGAGPGHIAAAARSLSTMGGRCGRLSRGQVRRRGYGPRPRHARNPVFRTVAGHPSPAAGRLCPARSTRCRRRGGPRRLTELGRPHDAGPPDGQLPSWGAPVAFSRRSTEPDRLVVPGHEAGREAESLLGRHSAGGQPFWSLRRQSFIALDIVAGATPTAASAAYVVLWFRWAAGPVQAGWAVPQSVRGRVGAVVPVFRGRWSTGGFRTCHG